MHRTLLITGGTGTLGTALTQRALQSTDLAVTIYSRSEVLQAAHMRRFAMYGARVRYVLGDVADASTTDAAIAGHDLVVHAAATKRIPEAERQPDAAYRTNVLGSANVLRSCLRHGVHRLIGISTDKACRAVTAYGATKLLMERSFIAARHDATVAGLDIGLVRYGNVVASRGSVVPLWRSLAADKGTIPITDPEATRFFMSINDAVDLVWCALFGAHCDSGILVPRMKALTLQRLAEIVAPDAATYRTGFRSIEKKHEDLISTEDRLVRDCEIDGWRIHPTAAPHPANGSTFDSAMAQELSRDEFLAMLAIAEEYE